MANKKHPRSQQLRPSSALTPPANPATNGNGIISARQKLLENLQSAMRSPAFLRAAGMQYSGLRDIYAVAGYRQGEIQFDDFMGQYKRGDIAGRIVDMPARTTWRKPPEVMEEGMEESGTEFSNAFNALAKRVRLWEYLARVDRSAGIGRYAVLMLGLKGGSDLSLRTKAAKSSSPNGASLLYLSVYTEGNAGINSWVTDPGDERFGLPEIYKLKTATPGGSFSGGVRPELLVHASRCIHVAENVLEDDVYGTPRLERPMNRLFDLEKVAASTGESYWQLAVQILQAKVDPAANISDDQMDVLDEKLKEIMHDLRRQFTGKGVGLEWLTSTTPNVSQVADFYFSLIAGSSAIPKRILFGSELGELASSQDETNYLGSIAERQLQFAEPTILRPFIDRCISLGILPTPTKNKGEYQVVWPPLSELTPLELGDLNLKIAQTASALTPMGGNPRELIRVSHEGLVELVEREPDEPLDLTEPGLNPDGTPIDPNHPDQNAPPEAGGNPVGERSPQKTGEPNADNPSQQQPAEQR